MPRQPKAFLACYLVLIRDGKILLAKRKNTGYGDEMYSMVAGHVEDGETIWDALARESKEEADMTVERSSMRMAHIIHRQDTDREYVDFFVQSDAAGEPRNMEPEKCYELKWFDLKDLPESTLPYVKIAIEGIMNGEFYSEYIDPELKPTTTL